MVERKMLCHRFSKAVDLLLALGILIQEVTDMLIHLVYLHPAILAH